MKKNGLIEAAKKAIRIEAQAISALVDRLDDDFVRAVEMIDGTRGRVILTGIGKSGIVAKKVASTFSSIGIPAFFFHPVEGMHGDLGVVRADDLLIVISKSGQTAEILGILPLFRRLEVPIVAITAEPNSLLGNAADIVLNVAVPQEASPDNLMPTSSTTAAMVMGDALAVALIKKRNLTVDDFATFHPAGTIGKSLVRVEQIMHTGDEIPKVHKDTPFLEMILEMTSKRLGTTTVVDEHGRLEGIVTDGDLRRAIAKHRQLENLTAADVMTAKPRTITRDKLAIDALNRMEKYKITSLAVVDGDNALVGFLHMHDILDAKVV